ncbi:MAG: hypothetical protein IJE97_11975 [Thermoguttaceae bacterium]|nr:hypothetical protein [Thermoguttaceae bacterium]
MTHPALFGRLLVYGALLIPALWAAWRIGKAAWEHIGVVFKTLGCLLTLGAAVAFCVAIWKLCGWWILAVPAVVLVLLGLGAIAIADDAAPSGGSSGSAYKKSKNVSKSASFGGFWRLGFMVFVAFLGGF